MNQDKKVISLAKEWTAKSQARAHELAVEYLTKKGLIFEGCHDNGYMGSAILIAIMIEPIETGLELGFSEATSLERGIEALENWILEP